MRVRAILQSASQAAIIIFGHERANRLSYSLARLRGRTGRTDRAPADGGPAAVRPGS